MAVIIFFLVISTGSMVGATFLNRKYEEMVPLTIFSCIEIVFLIGLFDQLKTGTYFLLIICSILYLSSMIFIFKKKSLKSFAVNFFTPAFWIFCVLIALYCFCMIGRVAYIHDEFSFWATSVKKMFYLDAYHCIPEAEPYFAEYPPGMQIFQFIIQVIRGDYTEWLLYLAYMIYVFALFLPFIKGLNPKKILGVVLVAIVIFSCGTIIYSNALDNLQVDFALGVTFAYGMALTFSGLLTDEGVNRFNVLNVIMASNMLVLIKSAGMLLSVILIIALVISVLRCTFFRRDLTKKNYTRMLKNFIPCILGIFLPFVTAFLWKKKYTYYQTHIAFETNYDIKEFLNILFNNTANMEYRIIVKQRFFDYLISEKISIGFLKINNIQLLLVLVVLFVFIMYVYKKNLLKGCGMGCGIMLFFVPIYWLGLLASYMYTFSEGEAVILASMQRYLNIYHVAIVVMIILLLLKLVSLVEKRIVWLPLLLVLCFISYRDIYSLVTRHSVENSISNRAVFSMIEEQLKLYDTVYNPNEKSTVLLIHRKGYPHTPVNHFTYLLWPNYIVPWECSYGSQALFDGDGYTSILDAEGFRNRVRNLGVDYIAISYCDDDFINTYSFLFDHDLKSGQVYRVIEGEKEFRLLNGIEAHN